VNPPCALGLGNLRQIERAPRALKVKPCEGQKKGSKGALSRKVHRFQSQHQYYSEHAKVHSKELPQLLGMLRLLVGRLFEVASQSPYNRCNCLVRSRSNFKNRQVLPCNTNAL
jgi:hypothetical protein